MNIPVLQTAGYFFGGPGAAEYYFREHYKHNPNAEHYLLIGSYDHVPGQRGVVSASRRYGVRISPVTARSGGAA